MRSFFFPSSQKPQNQASPRTRRSTRSSVRSASSVQPSSPEQPSAQPSSPEQPSAQPSSPEQPSAQQQVPDSGPSDSATMAAIVPRAAPPPPAANCYPIHGVPVADSTQVGPYKKVSPRQNIDEWSKDPDNEFQVKLFVMAWDRLQKRDPNDRDSFFQIAGIHGQPNVPWDEEHVTEEDTKDKGYCTHNCVLFPIWHRPYLVLLEQQLYEIMVNEIIPNFPAQAQAEWKQAADTWRLPFWDYGRTNKVPELAKYPTTVVPSQDGTGETRIDNPLFQFKMPNGKPMRTGKVADFLDPWVDPKDAAILRYGDCIGTSRWPDDEDVAKGSKAWMHGVVNNYKVEDAMKVGFNTGDMHYGQAAEVMYRLLTIPMDYSTFATTAQLSDDKSTSNDLNLEFLHNNIHGWVGGDFNGHMSQIPVATFDPLFWLHHCNIDRIFALWQALNPEKWFERSTMNQFFQLTVGLEAVGTEITPLTPLRPFHKDKEGAYLNSNDCRWTYDLGYTYPELQTWKDEYNEGGTFSNDKFVADITKTVNDYYGISRKLLLEADPSLAGIDQQEGGTKSIDYSFSVRFKKYAFGGDPFWVRIYLSQEEGKQNPTIDLLASVYNFSQKPETNGKVNCANCKSAKSANITVTAHITITPVLLALVKTGKHLAGISKDEVLEFIRKRAYWRVFKNGIELPKYEVAKTDLEIIGGTNDVHQPNDPKSPPTLENFVPEPTITGGPDGALDDSLKQPSVQPPPPVARTPAATLGIGENIPLPEPLSTDSVVIIESAKVDLTPDGGSGIDNSQIFFTTDGEGSGIVFLLSVRRAEGQIVFNHNLGSWGKETRVTLKDRFKNPNATILVHDEGDGYLVLIDSVYVLYYPKADTSKTAKYIHYTVNQGHKPAWSRQLNVRYYKSLMDQFKA